MYCIIILPPPPPPPKISMAHAHVNILGKLRECDLEEIGWFLSEFLHKPNLSVLPSGQGMLVAPQTYGGGLVPKISTPNEVLYSHCLWPKVFSLTYFRL